MTQPSRSNFSEELDLITDKWTAIIIYLLFQGTRRYSQLHREIDGVSQKMLTQTLRGLEWDGILEWKVYPVVPPITEYSLTSLGITLTEPLKSLCKWAETHLHEAQTARVKHDKANQKKAIAA